MNAVLRLMVAAVEFVWRWVVVVVVGWYKKSCPTPLQCWGCVVLCCRLGSWQLCNIMTGHIVRIRIRIKHHPVLSYCMCSHVSSKLCHVSCGDTCVQQSPATQQCSIHYPKCGQTRAHWIPLQGGGAARFVRGGGENMDGWNVLKIECGMPIKCCRLVTLYWI